GRAPPAPRRARRRPPRPCPSPSSSAPRSSRRSSRRSAWRASSLACGPASFAAGDVVVEVELELGERGHVALFGDAHGLEAPSMQRARSELGERSEMLRRAVALVRVEAVTGKARVFLEHAAIAR